jgi:CubicO group peptidase (beta-lactamase class C family)
MITFPSFNFMRCPVGLSLLVMACASCSDAGPEPAENEQRSAVELHWARTFERMIGDNAAGYAYAVYQDQEPAILGARGFARLPSADNPNGIRMTADTPMQVASVSKAITAVALLHALDAKGIDIDEPIWLHLQTRFSDPAKAFKAITARHLLSHRTGYAFGYIESPRLENTQAAISSGPEGEPGGEHQYSNINTSLARALLEVVTDTDYEHYVSKELFEPIGALSMTTRGGSITASDAHHFSEPIEGAPFDIDFSDTAGPYGWYGSAKDLAAFAGAVGTGRLLSVSDTRQMLEDGLGWTRATTHAGPGHGHDGQWIINEDGDGVRAGIAIYPQDVAVAFFVNTNGPYFPRKMMARAYEESLPRIAYQIDPDAGTVDISPMTPALADSAKCTDDGSDPASSASARSGPISAALPVEIRCIGFLHDKPAGFENRVALDEESDTFRTY